MLAQIIAAADVRDGIGKAAIQQRQPRCRESRRDRIAIGAIGIEIERTIAVFLEAFFVDDRNGHFRSVARGDLNAFGCVLARIIAAWDFLHLERLHLAGGHVIFSDRIGRDHRFIGQPQLGDLILGVLVKTRRIARFGESNPLGLAARIGVDFHLIEAIVASFDDEEISKGRHAGHVETGRRRNALGPFTGLSERRRHQPELGARVIGVDEERAVMLLYIIFHALLAFAHKDRLGERIVDGQQADFACFIVAGCDHDPLAAVRHANAGLETLIGFRIDHLIFSDRRAERVDQNLFHPPIVVDEAVEQMLAIG